MTFSKIFEFDFFHFNLNIFLSVSTSAQVCMNSVRFKKKGPPAQSQGNHYVEKYYGLKGIPGSFCNEKEIIVVQPDSKFHPGLNVSQKSDFNLLLIKCKSNSRIRIQLKVKKKNSLKLKLKRKLFLINLSLLPFDRLASIHATVRSMRFVPAPWP